MSTRETVKGTTVAYHSDGFGRGARPAINVKVHGIMRESREAAHRLSTTAIGIGEAENILDAAEREVYGEFWADADEMAQSLGLGQIEQEGRSGGWLVFTDGRDPMEFGGKARIEWLRAYRAMDEWCAEQVRQADAMVAARAFDIANELAVAP